MYKRQVYLNSTNSFDEPEALPEMKSAMNDLKNALSAKDLNKCATAVNSFWQAYNSYYMTIRGYGFYLLEQVGNTVYLDAYTTNSAAKFMICRYNLRDIIYTSTEENEALYYAAVSYTHLRHILI